MEFYILDCDYSDSMYGCVFWKILIVISFFYFLLCDVQNLDSCLVFEFSVQDLYLLCESLKDKRFFFVILFLVQRLQSVGESKIRLMINNLIKNRKFRLELKSKFLMDLFSDESKDSD